MDSPRKRAGNKDRELVVHSLTEAMADGQLTPAEFDERAALAWSAVYRDELASLTSDLSLPQLTSPSPSSAPSVPARVTGEAGGSNLSFSLMGETAKRGNWLCAPTHTSISVMGDSVVDLRNARLSTTETTITVVCVMGDAIIIVPEDCRVVDGGLGVMGGFKLRDHESATVSRSGLTDNAPLVRVRGMALMGDVDIIRASRDVKL